MAFNMKGSSLYGKINMNRGGNENRPDGRSKSSTFQHVDKIGEGYNSNKEHADAHNARHANGETHGVVGSKDNKWNETKQNTKKSPTEHRLTKRVPIKADFDRLPKNYPRDRAVELKHTHPPNETKGDNILLDGGGIIKSDKPGAPGIKDVIKGVKVAADTVKESAKSGFSDVGEGFRQLFTGDRVDRRKKKN